MILSVNLPRSLSFLRAMIAQIMSMITNWATRAATDSVVWGVLRTADIRTVPERSAAADLGTLVNVIMEIFRRWAVSNAC